MIKIKNVTKQFDDGNTIVTAVDDVSLNLDEGKFVAIIGPSGSGKSTLLTMIGALQTPTLGEVIIDQKDISNFSEKELSTLRFEKIGFVLQGSNLVPYLTIEEQFQMKRLKQKHADQSFQDELIKTLNIEHIMNKYPDEISGGERQRAAIGLSLLLKPSILLADEPTASLDTERAYAVVELLQKVSKHYNTTVIMVTHDTRMLAMCDEIYEMVDGNLKTFEETAV